MKDLVSEQIIFRRRAFLYGILFLQWYGWHEEEWIYWWLSVGLTCKSVVTFPPIRETATSKKSINLGDHSALNFIAGCFSFKCSINFVSLCSACFQSKKMLSMYLHRRYGFSSIPLKMSPSNSTTYNILYSGENFVLIATTRFCFKAFYSKATIFSLRPTLASSTRVEVVTFSSLKSSPLRWAGRPSSCGMFGYNPTLSKVHKIILSGNFSKEWDFPKNN